MSEKFARNFTDEVEETPQKSIKSIKTIIPLPDEMITEIFLRLNEINDLRKWMLVHKSVQDFVLKSSRIIRKIRIIFNCTTSLQDVLPFLDAFGAGIKFLKSDIKSLKSILLRTPNLEELTCGADLTDSNDQNQVDLLELKYLNVTGNFNLTKDTPNLQTLIINFKEIEKSDVLTDFIARQSKNLKVLTIETHNCNECAVPFPSRDISNECKFQLTKFTYKCGLCGFYWDLLFFLEQQLKTLKEVHLWGLLNQETFEVIFANGEMLEKLFIYSNTRYQDVSFKSIPYSLPSVKHYSTDLLFMFGRDSEEFNELFEKLPNVVSLRFEILLDVIACVPQLETLRILGFYPGRLLNLKLPNLRTFSISSVFGNNNREDFKTFCENAPNIEIVIFDEKKAEKNLRFIKNFKNILKLEVISWNLPALLVLVDFDEEIVYWNKIEPERLKTFQSHFSDFVFKEKNLGSAMRISY